ncbi:hypothetical protein [Bosea sp. (in: a-proteobacteria)]|uniref:hypothetical protein n=1 Tax=Bosea sp. (in: a-proteobacteria) TaxID=1871050 RepID=UPI00262A0FEC|nr:hypothetical protein [Bosea sp. (in: a-proteobacteria)]MCO5092004.1 hypothetical protein [Bosea sp. (in: a-proteobacteria)]
MFVERRDGAIVGAYRQLQPGLAEEWLAADDAGLAAFLAGPVAEISDRQFAQGLAGLGLISEVEAEEWVAAGTLPAAILALVEQLPEVGRFPARMLLRGATRFAFGHPLADAFAGLADPPWSTEARAAFWRHCASL